MSAAAVGRPVAACRLQFVRKTNKIYDMITVAKTARRIRQCIEGLPVGEPFTPAAFLEHGTRASVDQTLSRLAKAGVIERVARGVYVRPEINRFVGKVMPEPVKVVETLARNTGAVIQVHGAEAALQFGFTTQVPVQPVFATSGSSRRVRMGKLEIRLRHASPRKLALAGRPAGLALAAMWYLGKKELTPAAVARIQRRLPETEFQALRSVIGTMPSWMSDAIFQHEKSAANADV